AQHVPDRERVPSLPAEAWDSVPVQFVRYSREASTLGVPMEDTPHDLSLVRLDFPPPSRRVVDVAVGAPPHGLRDAAGSGTLQLATRGALGDLLALKLYG